MSIFIVASFLSFVFWASVFWASFKAAVPQPDGPCENDNFRLKLLKEVISGFSDPA
ncbi:hypothetical protein [Aquabacter spiritensis]|uniref:hypothetical protein n=1 Tax=Aquabacter spiritensis TaxID=933073 RepID=UPI0014054502|nr:hypothetical protein [Aquabacter spiritensis]